MTESEKVYRIRTNVGESPSVIKIPLNQTYDMFEILSLKLRDIDKYKTYESDYGVVVGRVVANNGIGVPNAKISIFLNVENNETLKNRLLYDFNSTSDQDNDGIRYNTLPDMLDSACHADVGTFPNKRLVLDNNTVMEIFDKYWKYTTTTNNAGDYMLFGIPVGQQTLHVDIDLSDCGMLSQKPRDMIRQGYNRNLFDSPTKFKKSTNLDGLPQIIRQEENLVVYPYWGDVSEGDDNIMITRADINITYKFETACVFMGSVITDKANNAIGKNCTANKNNGDMSEMTTGEGTIEMIRKTIDGQVEYFTIDGNRLIDSDGIWCYEIPMNLDYVVTDEFGNLVPTDDINKGIATRAKVRFRLTIDETVEDATARKRSKVLIPNNPRLTDDYPDFKESHQPDYEFGTNTKDESYVELFWNNVYTVKSYIPRLQKGKKTSVYEHTGIKQIKYFGDNNPMPYNSLVLKLSFQHRFICVLAKIVIFMVAFLNEFIIVPLAEPFAKICTGLRSVKIFGKRILKGLAKPFCSIAKALSCVKISENFCVDESGFGKTYYPGCKHQTWKLTREKHREKYKNDNYSNKPSVTQIDDGVSSLITCIENQIAQEYESASFIFSNDWVNGVVYLPLWYRRITKKHKYFFGLFTAKAHDDWCSEDRRQTGLKLFQPYAVERNKNDGTVKDKNINNAHNVTKSININNGVIVKRKTILDEDVYYYKSVQYISDIIEAEGNSETDSDTNSNDGVVILFATDVVLLGSLNDCDLYGVPQFFKTLESSTYNMPSDLLFVDATFTYNEDKETYNVEDESQFQSTRISEATGADWGNLNESDLCGKMGKDDFGGLFYDIGCSATITHPKTAVNLSRICEYGVIIDASKIIPDLDTINNVNMDEPSSNNILRPDGFISYDELFNIDERSMFATMNSNHLKTKYDSNSLRKYDFKYLYCDNFDGALKKIMENRLGKCSTTITYRNNYRLETKSNNYVTFRMGETPYYYDNDETFPRYENSFYFYFGLKNGKTAIDKFNKEYFSECVDNDNIQSQINYDTSPNSWCGEITDNYDGYVKFDFSKVTKPYNIILNSEDNSGKSWEINGIEEDKIYFSNNNISELDNSGYVRVMGGIPNGEYSIAIMDSDGDIIESSFTMSAERIKYLTDITDFAMDNDKLDTLKNQGENDSKIAKEGMENVTISDGHSAKRNTSDNTSKLNGLITIYNVIQNGEYLKVKDYSVRLRPIVADAYKIDFDYDLYIEGGVVDNTNPNPLYGSFRLITRNGTVTDDVDKAYGFVIGVPKGDVTYQLEITQICNLTSGETTVSFPTKNTSTLFVKVNEASSKKLMVGEVDINLLRKFKSGWNVSGTMENIRLGMTSEFYGWDDINNIWGTQYNETYLNIESVYYTDEDGKIHQQDGINFDELLGLLSGAITTDSPYTWTKEYKYTKYNYNQFSHLEDYEKEKALLEINDAFVNRNQLPQQMNDAFVITCPTSPLSSLITMTSSEYPISYAVNYHPDVYDDNDDSFKLMDSRDNRDNSYIDDIYNPTLTYKDNGVYKTRDINQNTQMKYTYALKDGSITNYIVKTPYVIGSCDAIGDTRPYDLPTTGTNPTVINRKGNASNFFIFHTIDKIMRVNNLTWSAFRDIPYVGSTGEHNSDFINMNGFSVLQINNGTIVEEVKDLDPVIIPTATEDNIIEYPIYTYFDEQLLGDNVLKIRRLSEDEQQLPVKRYVCGYQDENIQYDIPFTNYKIKIDDRDYDNALLPIEAKEYTLSLSQNCDALKDSTIHGGLHITILEENIVEEKNGHNYWNGNYSDGDGDYRSSLKVYCADAKMYYLFRLTNNNEYPLYNINYNDGKWSVTGEIYTTDTWKNNEETRRFLFSNGTTEEILKKQSTGHATGYVINSDGGEDKHTGFSSDGRFYFTEDHHNEYRHGKYFVVGVTENGCRVISPMYDLGGCKYNYNENGNEYIIKLDYGTEHPEYFDNYDYTVYLIHEENGNILTMKNDFTYLNKNLQNICVFEIPDGETRNNYWTVFKDVTGLRHKPTDSLSSLTYIEVTWKLPDDVNATWQDGGKELVLYFSNGTQYTTAMKKELDKLMVIDGNIVCTGWKDGNNTKNYDTQLNNNNTYTAEFQQQ